MFALDIIGAVPIGSLLIFACRLSAGDSGGVQLVRRLYLLDLLLLARLHRVWELVRWLRTIEKKGLLHVSVIIRNVFIVFFWSHWAACLFFIICELDVGSECGVFLKDSPVNTDHFFVWYLLSFYWSIVTYSTVGYGDITPLGLPATIYASLFILSSLSVTAYVVGTITSALNIYDGANYRKRQTKKHLRQFASSHGIPWEIEQELENEVFVGEEVKSRGDDAVFGRLPLPVRNTVSRFVYLPHLQSCPLLKQCSPQFLTALLSSARVEVFTNQSCVLDWFDEVDNLSIIAFGSAVMGFGLVPKSGSGVPQSESSSAGREPAEPQNPLHTKDSEAFIPSHLGPGDVYGAVSFFTGTPQPEVVSVSSTLCHVIMVSKEKYLEAAAEYPYDGYRVVNVLFQQAEQLMRSMLSQGSDSDAELLDLEMDLSVRESFQNRMPEHTDEPGDLHRQVKRSLCQLWIQRNIFWQRFASHFALRLLNATARNNAQQVAELLEQHDDPDNQFSLVDTADARGRTALMVACRHGHLGLVQGLLSSGASVNAVGRDGMTPLEEAIREGHSAVARLLLQRGAKMRASSLQASRMACVAIAEGKLEKLSLLIDAGIDINEPYLGGGTPLHVAAQHGSLDAVMLILDKAAGQSQGPETELCWKPHARCLRPLNPPRESGVTPPFSGRVPGGRMRACMCVWRGWLGAAAARSTAPSGKACRHSPWSQGFPQLN